MPSRRIKSTKFGSVKIMDSLSAFDDLYTAIEACLIYPDEVIDRLARAFYPAILACWNSEEGQRSLVGARPLHLACARPFGRLKAPLGLSLLRCAAQTRACRMAGGTGSSCKQRKTGSSHLLGIRKTVFEK